MIIAVSQRVDKIPSINEDRDSIDQRLINWILAAGFDPITVPNTIHNFDKLQNWINLIKPDGLLLSGGNDIGDSLNRDTTEKHLLNWAINYKKPVYGICRGMQFLAINHGVNLIKVDNHVNKIHKVSFFGKIKKVNSFHNFSISTIPKNFRVISKSEDGMIESIEHNFLPIIGVMWHPEREKRFDIHDLEIIKKLFSKSENVK